LCAVSDPQQLLRATHATRQRRWHSCPLLRVLLPPHSRNHTHPTPTPTTPWPTAGGDADGQGSGGLRSKAQLAKESVGRLEQLRLSERQFRGVISLLSGSQQLPEEALEDLDGQEQQ
jgi:hypothetical protein